MKRVIKGLDKIGVFSSWVNAVGVIAVFLMVAATCCDVFCRYVFKNPITGVYECTAACLVLAVFFSIAYTLNEKGHICVDLFTQKLSPKNHTINDLGNNIIGFVIACLMVWRAVEETIYFIEDHVAADQVIKIPATPFGFAMILGSILFALIFLRDILKCIQDGKEQRIEAKRWILGLLIPVVLIAVSVIIMYTKHSWDATAVGVIGIIVSLLFMFAGMPISISFIAASLIFISIIKNPKTAFQLLSNNMFSTTSSYSWTVIPFFLFMGYLVYEAEFGKDLYDAAYKWLGRLPGGLAIATVTACAAFAAIVGNGSAPCITMGAVALPEMRRYKYDERLSTGTIIGGTSLGPIIPPSQPLIIYAMLTMQSVGRLFIASLVPGIVLWLLFAVYILVICKIRPNMGPKGEKFTAREKGKSLVKGLPVLIIFLVVIGGIYLGIFSATEAGAIGCGLALIMALIMRRMTWKKLINALLETGKGTAMIFMILIGANMLGKVITLARLPQMLSGLIEALSMNPYLTLVIILLIFFALGFFIDIMPLILIGVPVVHPAMVALGFDPTWFTIILSIVIGIGTITPPVGINLFTLKGVARDVPIGTIYRGSLPFAFVTLALIILMIFIPQIVTWLPNLLFAA
ncbi:MAG: TRAP transporter large permease subunit [Parasporobacterium sp.]|nr:TRAP transporter large permease subunit [Parasporobacterium sp.]